MKLSIEAKVAVAIGMAFVALSIGAIAREQGERGPGSISDPALTQASSAENQLLVIQY
jgi:hypothetical protein